MEQLDAMQEPVLRERQQKDQQQEYIERVRKRAADRAREILGEAYQERQRILAEADAALEQKRAQLVHEIEAMKTEAATMHNEAKMELARAKQVAQEAEELKNKAHDEGFSLGMDQASQELKEFRADMGNELAMMMRKIEHEFERMVSFWRDDLCELTRVCVSSATTFVLDTQYKTIITNLVMQAVNLLEQREVIAFRVNPEDESLVQDLFRAAREKAPEIRQWIVTPDEMMDRGGLVAESGSGSVDLRRKNFQELVDSLLEHLALPVQEEERKQSAALASYVEERAQSYTQTETLSERDILTGKGLPLDEPQIEDEPEEEEPEDAVPAEVEEEIEEPVESVEPVEPVEEVPQKSEPSAEEESSLEPEKVQEIEAAMTQDPNKRRAMDISSEHFTQMPTPEDASKARLADLEEELFPLNQDEEHTVLANGGFLPHGNS